MHRLTEAAVVKAEQGSTLVLSLGQIKCDIAVKPHPDGDGKRLDPVILLLLLLCGRTRNDILHNLRINTKNADEFILGQTLPGRGQIAERTFHEDFSVFLIA